MNAESPVLPPIPPDEVERLAALQSYDILDTGAEQRFDDLTQLAAHICNMPIALVSLVDEKRQWFKSKVGLSLGETPRNTAFCAHAITQPEHLFIVQDALEDQRFAQNPLVTGEPGIRFYAGAPLVTEDGYALGTLCVLDSIPRQLTPTQLSALSAVRRQVLAQIELSRNLMELTQANLKLEQLNQTKNDFLHIAAHDLKNPLSAIMGYAEELQDIHAQVSAEEVQDIAQHIHHASRHMYDLVINLLDVNAIESGRHELKLEPTSLAPLFERLQHSYEKRARAKQIDLEVSQTFDGYVLGAESTLFQVLDNLVSNAIKYSPPHTQVRLCSRDTDTHVEILVQDQGQGFNATDKQHLFQKFTRLSARPTGGEHSSGLGLFIVKRLVDAMQAQIRCESEPQQGARFILDLKKA